MADLHVHSRFSDGTLTISELVDFYGQKGFGCIAVTDHICETGTFLGIAAKYLNLTLNKNNFDKYLEIINAEAERAWDLYKMVVIPGYELSQNNLSNHRSAHILGLGVNSFMDATGEPEELARQIRAQGALAIAAHPVPTGKLERQTLHLWSRREELRETFDAWEVASGANWFDEVAGSGLPLLATSDLHHPKQIRAWKTVFECERSAEAILNAIRKQKVKFKFYEAS